MSESTTVTLPVETKARLDRAHGDLHLTEGIPRWRTIEQALQALADDNDLDLEPDDSVDDDNDGRRRVRSGGRGR